LELASGLDLIVYGLNNEFQFMHILSANFGLSDNFEWSSKSLDLGVKKINELKRSLTPKSKDLGLQSKNIRRPKMKNWMS